MTRRPDGDIGPDALAATIRDGVLEALRAFPWPDEWTARLLDAARLAVWEIRSGSNRIHVVLGSVVAPEFPSPGAFSLGVPGRRHIEAIRQAYQHWAERNGGAPDRVVYALASATAWGAGAEARYGPDEMRVLVEPDRSRSADSSAELTPSAWQTRVPPGVLAPTLEPLIDALRPESLEQSAGRLAAYLSACGHETNTWPTLREAALDLDRSPVTIRRSFALLARSRDFSAYRENGERSIRLAVGAREDAVSLSRLGGEPSFLVRHVYLVSASLLSVVGVLTNRFLIGELGIHVALLPFVGVAYTLDRARAYLRAKAELSGGE